MFLFIGSVLLVTVNTSLEKPGVLLEVSNLMETICFALEKSTAKKHQRIHAAVCCKYLDLSLLIVHVKISVYFCPLENKELYHSFLRIIARTMIEFRSSLLGLEYVTKTMLLSSFWIV
jgi:hypothetical protein